MCRLNCNIYVLFLNRNEVTSLLNLLLCNLQQLKDLIKKEEEGMTKMYNQTGDNDIVRIIELTNDAGRLKKVEEFCGKNLPTLIKIDDA
jgi:hypothetical protein